jgi:hypothetical protein
MLLNQFAEAPYKAICHPEGRALCGLKDLNLKSCLDVTLRSFVHPSGWAQDDKRLGRRDILVRPEETRELLARPKKDMWGSCNPGMRRVVLAGMRGFA